MNRVVSPLARPMALAFGLVGLTLLAAHAQIPAQPYGPAPELGNPGLAKYAILDVTAAPFNADPTGETDTIEALEKAVNYARTNQMIAFFPPGTYRVSRTLECKQTARLKPRQSNADAGMGRSTRFYPNVLVGSRRGATRPKIRLAPNSPGFDNPERPRFVVWFYREAKVPPGGFPRRFAPNGCFGQRFQNIDIEIGPGNPGAVGIRFRGAQGSGVQDVTIDATHGFMGIEGACGSGGSHYNLTVIGGRIGANFTEAQPSPVVAGLQLLDQTETALVYGGWQALTITGARIRMRGPGPAIVTHNWGPYAGAMKIDGTDPQEYQSLNGQLNLCDASIEFTAASPGNVAVSAKQTVYMNNVFVKNAAQVVRTAAGQQLLGNRNGWLRIEEFVHAIDPALCRPYPHHTGEVLTYYYKSSVFIDGKKLHGRNHMGLLKPNVSPPPNLHLTHTWDDSFPSWESPQAVNVKKPPYNAKGDGKTDDYQALQTAIDENEIVFVPGGHFRTSQPLKLKPQTKLLGLSEHCSIIAGHLPKDSTDSPFLSETEPVALVQSADDARADTVLCGVKLSAPTRGGGHPLLWRSGGRSMIRNVHFWFSQKSIKVPAIHITGNAGGRIYSLYLEHGPTDPDYRHVLIEGTRHPLAIYQLNPEHVRADANMEIRDSRFVSVYGIKSEYMKTVILVKDSDHIRILGHGGNAWGAGCAALYVVENTPNFLAANMVDRCVKPRGEPLKYPDEWHMLLEKAPDGTEFKTEPLERPALYKRGNPLVRPISDSTVPARK